MLAKALADPYKLVEVNIVETSHLEVEDLKKVNACLFNGILFDKSQKKVGVVLPPDSFFALHKQEECVAVFEKVGLEGYFKLQP